MTLTKKADPQTGEILPYLGDPREIEQVLDENLAGDQLSPFDLDRVKIPAGGGTAWTVPSLDGEEMVKEIQGIIIGHRITRTYWAESFESSGGGSTPDCACHDIKTGRGIGNPGGDCDLCPLNQWASDPDGGPGKACRQSHLLFVMRPDELLPMVLVASPGSLAALRQYFAKLSSRRMNHRHVITGLGLEKTSNKKGLVYSRVQPLLVAVLDAESKAQADQVNEALSPLLNAVEVQREDLDGPPDYGDHHHIVVDSDEDPGASSGEAEGADLFSEESPDQAAVKLPASCSSMVLLQQLWARFGWSLEKVEAEVLPAGKTISEYLSSGDNSKGRLTNALYQEWRSKAGV